MKRSIIALSKRNSIIGEMISCYQKVLEDGGHTYYMIWIFEDQPDHVYTSEVENGSKFCGLYDDDKEAECFITIRADQDDLDYLDAKRSEGERAEAKALTYLMRRFIYRVYSLFYQGIDQLVTMELFDAAEGKEEV